MPRIRYVPYNRQGRQRKRKFRWQFRRIGTKIEYFTVETLSSRSPGSSIFPSFLDFRTRCVVTAGVVRGAPPRWVFGLSRGRHLARSLQRNVSMLFRVFGVVLALSMSGQKDNLEPTDKL